MRRQILLVNIVSLLIGISYGMHNPILPIFASEAIGATYSEIGAIGVANFAPYIFVPLFVGILLDRFNRGWILTAGVALNAVSTYALSIVHTVPEIMVCRIGTGIAHAFFWPPCEAIISSVSSGAERVRNIARFVGFFVAGFTIGPLLGSLLLSSAGFEYRTLFQLAAFVMAAALVSSISASRIRTVATSVRVSQKISGPSRPAAQYAMSGSHESDNLSLHRHVQTLHLCYARSTMTILPPLRKGTLCTSEIASVVLLHLEFTRTCGIKHQRNGMCSKTLAGGFSNNLLVFLSMGKRGSYIMIFKLPCIWKGLSLTCCQQHMKRAASKTTSPGFMRPRIPVSR